MASKKVCVVGAGVSGLVSARELRREGHDVTVMEQCGGVGGQWLYDRRTDVHSCIYASLRLILPRQAMSFSDFLFYPRDGGDARRYPGHGEFLRYIRDYCDKFGLMDAVRLHTKVLRVAKMDDEAGDSRWLVKSCTRRGEDDGAGEAVVNEEVFDAVVVAVGQYAQPRLPNINGMEKWKRRQLHSHSPWTTSSPPCPRRCRGTAIYTYSFAFLDTGGAVTVDDNRVGPLHEHTFPPALAPSLSFVGVPRKVIVPRFYELQARWVAQVLSGRQTLPPVEEMLRSVAEYNRAREMAGVPKSHTHVIFDLEYCDEFGEKHCGFPRLPEWKKELVWSSIHNMRDDHEMFRDNYHDSELVREGLRSQGWLAGPEDNVQDRIKV
ncbi:hypothetical protein EJB05_13712, partial [Eragrostis curvula]